MPRYFFDKEQHLHTLDGAPLTGTSSVSNVIAKPLTWWASGLACEVMGMPDRALFAKIKKNQLSTDERDKLMVDLSVKHAEIKDMSLDEFLELLDTAYRAHDAYKKEAAEKGTDLHGEIEKWVKAEIADEPITPHERINSLVEWGKKNVKRWLWSEAHCFSEKLWIGGICDIGAELLNGSIIVLDAKSAKAAYANMFIQPALYDLQISENGGFMSDGSFSFKLEKPITKYGIIPFGAEKIEPFIREDVENCKEAALAALKLYKFLPRE